MIYVTVIAILLLLPWTSYANNGSSKGVYTVVMKGISKDKVRAVADYIVGRDSDSNVPEFRAKVKKLMNSVGMITIKAASDFAVDELRQTRDIIGVYPSQPTWKSDIANNTAALPIVDMLNSRKDAQSYLMVPRDANRVRSSNVSTLDYCHSATYQWGLDRIDQRSNALDCKQYDAGSYTNYGANVDVYVFDTGIQLDHVEFQGGSRIIKQEWDFFGTGTAVNNDLDGHGTHVASIVAGVNVGVAKKAGIYAVKVLDTNGGNTADLIEAIDLLIAKKQSKKKRRMIANMSLGTSSNEAVNIAVKRLTDARVPVITSAGNNNANACNFSPSGESSAVTVGAFEKSGNFDTRYSNFGSCVDISAPGTFILAAKSSSKSKNSYATLSGTSMAAPHVSGVLALHLSQGDFPGYSKRPSAARIHALLHCTASENKMNQVPNNTPNLLIWRPHKDYGDALTSCIEERTSAGL